MDYQVEEGTPIGITHRVLVRNVTSNYIIAVSKIIGDLKPKGMDMYGWCRYLPLLYPTKGLVPKLSKNLEAGMSQRVVQNGVLQKRTSLVSNRYFHLSTTHLKKI